MAEPYNYTDPDMCRLEVRYGPVSGNVVLETCDPSDGAEVDVLVRGKDLDGLAASLYEAADRDVIVLDRPNWYGSDRTSYTINGLRVERADKKITFHGVTFGAETARGLARILADMAEDADDEPDPVDLEALAKVLRAAADRDVQAADGDGQDLARLILAAGYRKEASRG